LGILLVHAPSHNGWLCFSFRCLEDRDMEQVIDPIVEQLDREYRFLRSELEKEVNRFETIRHQHTVKTNQLADDITRKFFELQNAKLEARRNERG